MKCLFSATEVADTEKLLSSVYVIAGEASHWKIIRLLKIILIHPYKPFIPDSGIGVNPLPPQSQFTNHKSL